ncbi:Phosphate-binding protein PstS [Tetrabaena socialis]|uniref:Phosphate-binding protein PstS n=1 Tax=Tetrabaena socialis TaxID=47790 RepID=A0A2J7ZY51_9CHLO|nr:Phosphate-binding protein PstS [Tetrabaena socialis]|eukprot:PNH05193.1 Phosphate-binding protein PstS [Tetrabaena socialis]
MARINAIASATLLALLMAVAPGSAQLEAQLPQYQLHGSGTSNPALLVWRVMDIMMARVKPKVVLSYRSVGSGSGAADFNTSASAFGCGDVPVPKSVYDNVSMIHVPYLVGGVSVFHNVPGVGEGMMLDPCTLARIFSGQISSWNDASIVGQNPHLPDLATITSPINIVHRNPGSSSTYALTHYFNKTCPEQWTLAPTSRPVGVTTTWPDDAKGRWQTVTNSQFMVEGIASTPFSLGYVESGQGVNAGLQEVSIRNAFGAFLTSDIAEVASPQLIADIFPLSDLSSPAWVNVNPVYASPTNPKQWPMTLGTYFYVRRDLRALAESGGLLIQFLNYMLSADVATMMRDYFFTPLPADARSAVLAGIAASVTVSTTVPWRYEPRTNNTYGQQNFVFSNQRDSYLVQTVPGLVADVKEAKHTLMLGDAYQVHGSGAFESALMLRRAMQAMQCHARVPISMTYRSVGSVEAQAEFADYSNMYSSYNHFKVSDMPLDSAKWDALNAAPAVNTTAAVLQLPFAISALGLYYNKALPGSSLVLNCSVLARLYTGAALSWSDSEIVALNGYSASASQTLLNYPIVVYGIAWPSGSTWALTGYFATACAAVWGRGQLVNVTWEGAVQSTFNGSLIRTPEEMMAAIAATPNSIGYAPSPAGAASGLAEVKLLVDNQPLLSAQASLATAVVKAQVANPALFTNATVDVSKAVGLSLYGQAGAWPIPIVQYLLMYRNLTGYGYSGPLLRAFAEFLLGPGGSDLATTSGLTPMPEAVQAAMRSAVDLSILKTLTVVWSTEPEGTYDETGSGLYTFSENRMSYEAIALAEVQQDLAAVKSQLAASSTATLRLACTADIYAYTRLLRGDLQEMSSSPTRVLDEMLPAASSIAALTAAVTGSAAPTHMIIHPGPLLSEQWGSLSRNVSIVQMPSTIRPVALVYKGAAGFRLSPCSLAKIIKGDIKNWDDASIKDDNPNFALPSNTITLLTGGPTDGDAMAMLQYIRYAITAASCPAAANLVLPTSGMVPNERIVAQLAGSANSLSGLGIVAAAGLVSDDALGAGLQAVLLPSIRSGSFITPMQTGNLRGASSCPDSGCAAPVALAYTAAVEDIVTSVTSLNQLGVPQDRTGDWSAFTLLPVGGPKPGQDVYPVFRLDFFVGLADLSRYAEIGPVVRAAVAYTATDTMVKRVTSSLGPYFSGLGPNTRIQLVQPSLAALQTSPTATGWSIVDTSAAQASSANPAGTVVLSRAPDMSEVALPGTRAWSAAAVGADTSTFVGRGDVQVIAEQLVRDATAELRHDQDKLDLAYSIGIAALILALVLSLTALVLAAYAVAVLRRNASSSSNGCFTPAAAKYEQHVDAPAGPHVEMQVQPHNARV